jgi:predicted DNA-binding transcriptional regulator AlpA
MHEHSPAIQPNPANELLTVSDLALILKCKESSVYNLTRRRGAARYDNPIPVLRLPMGLRFRRSSVLAWLESQETRGERQAAD